MSLVLERHVLQAITEAGYVLVPREVLVPFSNAALAFPDPGPLGSATAQIVVETPSKSLPNFFITSRDLWAARNMLLQKPRSGT